MTDKTAIEVATDIAERCQRARRKAKTEERFTLAMALRNAARILEDVIEGYQDPGAPFNGASTRAPMPTTETTVGDNGAA